LVKKRASEKMKTYLDCIPCFIRQPLEAVRMVTEDETVHAQVIKEVLKYLQTLSFESPPPESSKEVHAIVKKITNCKDPYKKVKDQSNAMAEKLYPRLKELVRKADDPLLTAVKLTIVGNVIDFGSINRFDVNDMIGGSLKREFIDNSYPRFKEALDDAKTVLYLADNAGEIFFDKLLLEEFAKRQKKVTCVVKANPIINDAIIKDAKTAGIDKFAKIISGDAGQADSTPGILLKFASKEFLEHFNSADMVIAKGQGNYESLSNVKRKIFFMLVVKCPLVAHNIGNDVGKLILKVKE